MKNNELVEEGKTHAKLEIMADDLWQTGMILADMIDRKSGRMINTEDKRLTGLVEANEIINDAWQDLSGKLQLDNVDFKVLGNCHVKVEEQDLAIAVTRILQWLAQRKDQVSSGVRPAITVECREERGSYVIFEDNSDRLPKRLRDYIFQPVSLTGLKSDLVRENLPGLYLPLYLAKMLVEEKYGGRLEDKTEEMRGTIGHRLEIRFNLAKSVARSGV